MKKIISYILFFACGISTVFNILYIADITDEIWFRLGSTLVILCSVIINISSLREKKRDDKYGAKENSDKTLDLNLKKPISFLLIILFLVWVITYFVAVFY